MSECAHCRATKGNAHRHDCGVARRNGLPRAPEPVPPPHVGALVQWCPGPKEAPRAAIVVRVMDDGTPVLRVLDEDPADDFKTAARHEADPLAEDDERWRWPK
jgi:hypothetical protein